jgi:hypothetical protein
MDQTNTPAGPSDAERNERVRKVLMAAAFPMDAKEIGRRIGEPWCCYGREGMGESIKPVCKRIGAVEKKGKWTLKADGA